MGKLVNLNSMNLRRATHGRKDGENACACADVGHRLAFELGSKEMAYNQCSGLMVASAECHLRVNHYIIFGLRDIGMK